MRLYIDSLSYPYDNVNLDFSNKYMIGMFILKELLRFEENHRQCKPAMNLFIKLGL